MSRPVTLFTGQWADLPLETLAQKVSEWGFDGLELACWGDHFDVDRALSEDGYVREKRDLLEKYGLQCWAISTHLVGQCVCDPIDNRHKGILPEYVWGDGEPEGVRQRAAEEVKNTAKAAKLFGVDVVNGFTGSSVWAKLYFFPPTSQADIDAGYVDFAERWTPIFDVFHEQGVKLRSGGASHRDRIRHHHDRACAGGGGLSSGLWRQLRSEPSDPSVYRPGGVHQRLPGSHLSTSTSRTPRCNLTGRNSILSSHLDFGDPRRGWDFVSPGTAT